MGGRQCRPLVAEQLLVSSHAGVSSCGVSSYARRALHDMPSYTLDSERSSIHAWFSLPATPDDAWRIRRLRHAHGTRFHWPRNAAWSNARHPAVVGPCSAGYTVSHLARHPTLSFRSH